jgi:alpha-L-fucosidase 2
MTFRPFERAKLHSIPCEKPAINFFEGALLGNGGLGVVVTTRPDSVLLHFGHNNVWDIRIAENHKDEIGTFAEIFAKIKALSPDLKALEDDPWYNEYLRMTESNYAAPYPHPFPCGSLLLSFDRRRAEVMGHHLDISRGLCEVRFRVPESNAETRLQIFTDMETDRVWLRMVDASGQPASAPFERVRLLPDPDTPKEIPHFAVVTGLDKDSVAFSQILPFSEPERYNSVVGHPKDRAFRLSLRLNAEVTTWQPQTSRCDPRPVDPLERAITAAPAFMACVQLEEGLASSVNNQTVTLPTLSLTGWQTAAERSQAVWEAFGKSQVLH